MQGAVNVILGSKNLPFYLPLFKREGKKDVAHCSMRCFSVYTRLILQSSMVHFLSRVHSEAPLDLLLLNISLVTSAQVHFSPLRPDWAALQLVLVCREGKVGPAATCLDI